MDFDYSLIIYLFFSLKVIFDGKSICQWEHHIPVINCDEGMWCHSTRLELFYLDDNFCRKALWVLALSLWSKPTSSRM